MTKEELAEKLGLSEPDINALRQAVVTKAFEESAGKRALVLIGPYPFFIVGSIVEVLSDYLVIEAEITNVTELDDEIFRIHIDNIEVFYIEEDGKPIPDIRDVTL